MGGDVNAVDRARETPLHQAALFGCDGMVKLLIAFGAFVDARDEFGQTPLHLAARSGSSESVTVLLKVWGNLTCGMGQRMCRPFGLGCDHSASSVSEFSFAHHAQNIHHTTHCFCPPHAHASRLHVQEGLA